MTRLTSDWISEMENTAALWNNRLYNRTGLDYVKIAALVAERKEEDILQAADKYRIAVVPVTSGLGTITSFSESVAAIVKAMGFDAFVTEATDINGIYEAHLKNADIIYMADDDRYIALNVKNGKVGDNNIATAYGFTEILNKMAGGVSGKDIAVLGYGIIGQLMAEHLAAKGAKVAVYDKDINKQRQVLDGGHLWIDNINDIKNYRFIADGTSEGEWLDEKMLADDVLIAAPGIPFSLTAAARQNIEGQYIHDLLEIGTAGMLGLAI